MDFALGVLGFFFSSIIGLLIFAILVGINFIPSLVAFMRNHSSKWAILIMNVVSVFLIWTVIISIIMWIAALIWAFAGRHEQDR